MRFAPLACLLLLATTVSAQPRPLFEVRTDKAVYASGEPILATVSISNPTDETIRYFFSSGCQFAFALDGERLDIGLCTLARTWTTIEPGMQWEGTAVIAPDSTGYPETGGAHTLTAHADVDGFAMSTNGALPPGPVPAGFELPDATADEFTAPAADAGVVSVAYSVTADVEEVREALNAVTVREYSTGDTRYESWQVSGAPLLSIVAAYENDGRFIDFGIDPEYRGVQVRESRFVTSTARLSLVPTGMEAYPNPCRSACTVELRARGLGRSVRVAVYDARGREVALVHDGPLAGDTQRWALPVEGWAAGTYVVRAEVGGRRFASAPLSLAR